jgi:integrase
MNITISRAIPLPTSLAHRPEYHYQLPPGFWYVVDDDEQLIIEPLLLYLIDRFIRHGKYKAAHTHKATAYDLADWWKFLVEKKIAWPDTDTRLVVEYRDSRLSKVSYQTHEKLKRATVKRRLGNIIAFYKWAFSRNIFVLSTLDEEEVRQVPRSIDADPLAQTRASFTEATLSKLLPEEDSGSGVAVHVINRDKHWPLLQSELGPLPNAANEENDPRPSRDRLAAELSFSTGLRVDEAAKLTILQILNLYIPPHALPHDTVSMEVTETKGLVARKVFVPVYLVRELLSYIDHERKACVDAGGKYKLQRHNRLFVNGTNSRQHVGKPVHPDTFDRQFRAAVLRAGLVQYVEKADPETGQQYLTKDSKHTYHHLRHSFAIYKYKALKEAGVASPWLELSRELGHRSLKTTMDIYLADLNEDRSAVNKRVFEASRSVWNGN